MNMHAIDWVIVGCFLSILTIGALSTRRFSKSVSGFLAAERCGGKYLICVANSIAGVGLITVMYFFQIHYDNGFTGQWWNLIAGPLGLMGIILIVTGWVVFRFRQTRALTLAQFFEMRYSRSFRVFTGFAAFLSGILNFGIFPSIGARFFIHFCGLPQTFTVPGIDIAISSYAFIMATLLIISVIFTFLGGQIAIMLTDFLQGTFSYIAFLLVIFFLFWTFSKTQLSETLLAAEPGHSLVNPFDIGKEENFNPGFYLIGFVLSFYVVLAWQGNAGYNCAAKSAHEAKMANMLSNWRTLAILPVLYVLTPLTVHVYLKHPDYAAKAVEVHQVLKQQADEKLLRLAENDAARANDYRLLTQLSVQQSQQLLKLTEIENNETATEHLSEIAPLQSKTVDESVKLAHLLKDNTSEVKSQTRLPLVIGRVLPKGLIGLFCAALLAAFISTHNTYLHSWGAILIQDIILPFRKTHLETRTHLRLLRCAIAGVAVYIFFFSLYFEHSQRIIMYTTITWSIFVSGAGSVIIGGLYWKRGTTAAAWTAMIAGITLSILGVFVSQSSPSAVFAAQEQPFWISVTNILSKIGCDDLFWKVVVGLFELTAQELLFGTCGICIFLYIIVSLLGKKHHFNMDKMLHRGKYKIEGDSSADILEAQTIWQKFGFSKDFSRTDYFIAGITIAWPVFWSVVFIVGSLFRNRISDTSWFEFWYGWLWFMLALGVVLTIWFTVGGIGNIIEFFQRLREQHAASADDGFVRHEEYETDEKPENKS